MNFKDWKIQSKRMNNYVQHLPMNCGGVAAVFALYGLNKVVPEIMIKTVLVKEKVSGMKILDYINNGRQPNIKSVFFGLGSIIRNSKDDKESTMKIKYLDSFSSQEVAEVGLQSILEAYNARCLIISCMTEKGIHWQTCYLPAKSQNLTWYNAFGKWETAVDYKYAGSPTGLILVYGPRITDG